MAKAHTPFEALDAEGINHILISGFFTRDKQLLCLAAAIEIEDLAMSFFMPINKAARQALAERLWVIAKAQREILVNPAANIATERQALVSAGVTESVINRCN